LRNSERSTLKTCEWQWDVIYNRRLKPHYGAPALRFGTLVHAALARYYKPGKERGPHPAKTFARLYKKELETASKMGFRDDDGVWQEAGGLGVAILENYIDHFGADEDWEVLVTEFPFETVVYKPWTYDSNYPIAAQDSAEPWFRYVGVLDGVWRQISTGRPHIPDHKTTSGIGGTTQHPKIPPYLLMDDQAGGYWSFGVEALVHEQLLRDNEKLAGMLYNFIRKQKPDERPYKLLNQQKVHLNKDGSISKVQPSPYFVRIPILRDDYDRQMARNRAEVDYRRIELFRSGELEISKNPRRDTCSWCPVRDACELHETGHDYESLLKATMREWDPYAEHEVREGR
jgi:hypothetical protein